MTSKIYLITLILLASLSICHADTLNNEKQLIEQLELTKSLIALASKENHLWRDTQKLFDQAEQLFNNKDYSKVKPLLNQVNFQIKQGQIQATSQKEINSLLPYYLKP